MRKERSAVDAALELVRAKLRDWDPIGVFPNWESSPAWDEYDSYAGHIVTLLSSGADDHVIAQELTRIRIGPMGLPPLPRRDAEIARSLVSEWRRANPLGVRRA